MTMKPHTLELNLDLDGVFADFEGGVVKICGKKPSELPKNRMWSIVHSKKDFFLTLDRMDEGIKLWKHIEHIHHELGIPVKFLTGAPSSQAFRDQKKAWVLKHKGERYECIVLPKKDKQLHSGPWKVLIDDTQINIDQWVEKGGYGLFYDGTAATTIAQLEEILALYLAARGQKDTRSIA
jgi:hypothetical protein